MLLENVSFKGKTGIITGGAQGIGKSKKEAEQMAAKKALENMGC